MADYYNIKAVSSSLQLGKLGLKLINDNNVLKLKNNNETQFLNLSGADPINNEDFVTKFYYENNTNKIIYGTGAPSNAIGLNNDTYLDKSNGTDVFLYGPKTNNIWPTGINLRGPQGPQGPSGAGVIGDSFVPYYTQFNRPQRWRRLVGTATTYTETVTSSYIEYTNTAAGTQQIGPSIPIQQLGKRTIIVEGTFSGTINSQSGLFFGIGGLSYGSLDSANAVLAVWRSNGAIVISNSSASTITTWSKTPTENLTQTAWVSNDILKMVWKFDNDSAIATLTLFKNDIPTGQTFTVTGITEGCIWAGCRMTATGQTFRITQLTVLDNESIPNFYIDSNYIGGFNDGTETKPFTNLATIQDLLSATGIRNFRLFIKGTHRGRTLNFSSDYKSIEIYANEADDVRIYGSTQVTSGWTATSGVPNVYERNNWLFDGVANQPNGGVFDPNRIDGPRPFTSYTRRNANTAPSLLNEGEFTIWTNSPNNGKLFIKPFDNVDPNTLTLELSNRSNCISIGGGSSSYDNTRVKIVGVKTYFSYNHNINLNRCHFELDDLTIYGSVVASGVTMLDAGGYAENCTVYGPYNDCWATVASGDTTTRRPKINLRNCFGFGPFAGDGVSCHNTANITIIGGEYSDTGKDGVVLAPDSSGGYIDCIGVICRRNTDSGFKNAGNPALGLEQRMRLMGCWSDYSTIGVNTNNTASASQGLLVTDAVNVLITNSINRKILLTNSNGASRSSEVQLNLANVNVSGGGIDIINNNGTIVGYPTRVLGTDIIFVNEPSDFPPAISGVITLEAYKTYFITNTVDLTGNRLVLGQNTVILGTSSENAKLISTGLTGTALITGTRSFPLRNITIEANIALSLTAATTSETLNWESVNFVNCNTIGTISGYSNFIANNCAILNSQGLTFTGVMGTIAFDQCLMDCSANGTLIIISSSANIQRRFRMRTCALIIDTNETGINFSTSASVLVESYILDQVNFSGNGTYTTGVTFSDNKSNWKECKGINNSGSIAQMYANNSNVTTTISAINTPVKAQIITTASDINQRFSHNSNRLQYTGGISAYFEISIVCSVSAGNNNTITIQLYKNNSLVQGSQAISTTSGSGRSENIKSQIITQLSTNDYIEVFVSNGASNNIVVSDLNVIVKPI